MSVTEDLNGRYRDTAPVPLLGNHSRREVDLVPSGLARLLQRVSGTYFYRRQPIGRRKIDFKLDPLIPETAIPPVPDPGPGVATMDGAMRRDSLVAVRESTVWDGPGADYEELRLDVDGWYPQLAVSATVYAGLPGQRSDWVAKLRPSGENRWDGKVIVVEAGGDFPEYGQDITIQVSPGVDGHPEEAVVHYHPYWTALGTRPGFRRTYTWKSADLRAVQFEYDSTPDATPVVTINTHAHPNRPASLPREDLTVREVFSRAGFAVTEAGDNAQVPLAGAGANGTWSNAELHDAMQTYWSRFANAPQWALWVFWAAMHDDGPTLSGIMFDDIGPNRRQGTAVFTESLIKEAPAGDTAPDAWVDRLKFFAAIHEMGHAFNLLHSWAKSAYYTAQRQLAEPWRHADTSDPEARSFMNYPQYVKGGQSAFFANFAYRFTDEELLFMRHAPAEYVQMGTKYWGDNFGLTLPEPTPGTIPEFRLQLQTNRPTSSYDFLEPVVLELQLTNTSGEPRIVRDGMLDPQNVLTVINPIGQDVRRWRPYARTCVTPTARVLEAGQSLTARLPIFAGLNGWVVSDPGTYEITAAVDIDDTIYVSAPLRLKVQAPRTWDESALAHGFFTDDVGRALAFNGTATLDAANDTLREVLERLPDSRAAIHAAAALAAPLARGYKLLNIPSHPAAMTSVAGAGGQIRKRPADIEQAVQLAERAFTARDTTETLGLRGLRHLADALCRDLQEAGAAEEANTLQDKIRRTLSEGRPSSGSDEGTQA